MSTAMRSPMRDRSTRYPKVSSPWERGWGTQGRPGGSSVCPQALPSCLYLQAIEEEQVGAEMPGLTQEVAHVVPCVLGHNLHQLAQEQGDLHVHQCCTQRQLEGCRH